jgi:hypothetical protein
MKYEDDNARRFLRKDKLKLNILTIIDFCISIHNKLKNVSNSMKINKFL